MFTVLIAEKKHIDAIRQEEKLFFEPFLSKTDSGEYAFCEWKPEGQTLNEAVPGLLDAVAKKKDWRAVVIHSAPTEQLKKQNPFDEVDYSAVAELKIPEDPELDAEKAKNKGNVWGDWLKEWKSYYERFREEREKVLSKALDLPLQRLATWLCFRPADYVLADVNKKQDIEDWVFSKLKERDEEEAQKKAEDEKVSLSDDEKESIGLRPGHELEKLEEEQYRDQMRLKEKLRREFVGSDSINIAYPAEVCCVSERITENGFFDPDVFWNSGPNNSYSAFVDRNMFFDKMRFMVFDVLPETHRSHRTDRLRFLSAVMILATNPMPLSAAQPRKLYVLESENDDTPLYTLATSFEKKLSSTSEVIENEIEKIRDSIPGGMTDREAEAQFCVPTDIPVTLDSSCDTDALYASKNFGLSSSCPQEEFYVWQNDFNKSKKSLAYIVKQQNRSVRKSVSKLDLMSEVNGRDISRLSQFQIDDVRDFTENAEDEMVSELPPDFSTIAKYKQQMEESNEEVRKVIERRMSKKTTIVMGAIGLGLFALCFLPLLIGNLLNPLAMSTGLTLIGVTLALVAVIMLVTLFFLRIPLRNAVRNFNDKMHDIMNDINGALRKYSKYLSAVCNVRRGNAVLEYSEKNADEYTKSIRIRRKHQEDIRRRRAFLIEEYGEFIMDNSYCEETMSRPYEYDFGMKVEYEYPAPFLAGDSRQVEFLVPGNYVTVPSSYVTRLLIREEEIYDR